MTAPDTASCAPAKPPMQKSPTRRPAPTLGCAGRAYSAAASNANDGARLRQRKSNSARTRGLSSELQPKWAVARLEIGLHRAWRWIEQTEGKREQPYIPGLNAGALRLGQVIKEGSTRATES